MQTCLWTGAQWRTGYLLLDAATVDASRFSLPLPMLRCTPPSLSAADALMPRLIELASLSPEQRDSLLAPLIAETAQQRPPVVCAWLDCPLPGEALARCIASGLIGMERGRRVMWRYFDPRVLSLAMHCLSQAQRQALLGPIAEWRFPWCGRWWSVRGSGPGAPGDSAAAWPSEAQWNSLAHADILNTVLIQLQRQRPPLSDQQCLDYRDAIDRSLLYAKDTLRLSDADDLGEYALLCALHGDALRHRALDAAFTDLAQGRRQWSEVAAMAAAMLTTQDEAEQPRERSQ